MDSTFLALDLMDPALPPITTTIAIIIVGITDGIIGEIGIERCEN